MDTLKAFIFAISMPCLLIYAFQYNVIKSSVNRSPAVVKETKVKHINTVKENVFNYLVTLK